MTDSTPDSTNTSEASPGESKAEVSLLGSLPMRILAGLCILLVIGALALIPLQDGLEFQTRFGFVYTFVHALAIVGGVVVLWVVIGLVRRFSSKSRGAGSPGGDTF